MGLDGGTKISRSDVLRGSSWRLLDCDTSRSTRGGCVSTSKVMEQAWGDSLQEQGLDKATDREAKLSCCHFSGEPLQNPVAADYLGHLYNKQSLVEWLLAAGHGSYTDEDARHRHANILRTNAANLTHIKRQRDTITLHLTPANHACQSGRSHLRSAAPDRAAPPPPAPAAAQDTAAGPFRGLADLVCPISQLPFATSPCVVIAPCGHVYAHRGLKQIVTDDAAVCAVCDHLFDPLLDVIELLPSAAKLEEQRKLISTRRKLRKAIQDPAAATAKHHIDDADASSRPSQRARLQPPPAQITL